METHSTQNQTYPMPELIPFELMDESTYLPETKNKVNDADYSKLRNTFKIPQELDESLSIWLYGRQKSSQAKTNKLTGIFKHILK